MYEYELKGANGKTYRMHADTPEDACRRAADLYQVAIVAWRHSPVALVLAHPSQIIG